MNIYGRIRACNCTDRESVLDKHMRLAHFFLQDITEIFYLIFYSKQCTRLVYSHISQIKTCKFLRNSQYIILLCYLWQLRSKDFYPEMAFHSYRVSYRICDKGALLAIIIHIVVVLCIPSLSE